MKKIRKQVSLDKDLVELADRDISNLSEFFNTILRAYFTTGDLEYDELQYQYLTNNRRINDCRVNNVLIRNRLNELEEQLEVKDIDKNKAWRRLWLPYSRTEEIDQEALSVAVEVLGYDEHELMVVLDNCLDYHDHVLLQSWDKVVECVL